MAEKNRFTKREKYGMLRELAEGNDMLIKFIDHEIELLDRKTSKSATATPAQKDALAISEIIKDILAECPDEKGMTVGALLKDERIKAYKRHNGADVSSQVITAILSKYKADFRNTMEKRVSYYSLVYGEVVDEGEGV